MIHVRRIVSFLGLLSVLLPILSSGYNNISHRSIVDHKHNRCRSTGTGTPIKCSRPGVCKSPSSLAKRHASQLFVEAFDDASRQDDQQNFSSLEFELGTAPPLLAIFPIAAALFGFLSFEESRMLFDAASSWIAQSAFNPGPGALSVPGGIVMSSIGFMFATLVSTTISTLWQRQAKVLTCLNEEAAELNLLQLLSNKYPDDSRKEVGALLDQYRGTLVLESNARDLRLLSTADETLELLVLELNKITEAEKEVYPGLVFQSYMAMTRINSQRAARISALRSSFPLVHYFTLAALGAAICTVFLLETNGTSFDQDMYPLRVFWSILLGSFSTLGIICYILSQALIDSFKTR